mmetsp:Transcript_8214/g.27295  ORF Transcript_8214/g.27295 Transcript_8214/m.27295 type:complete len:204 (-) Transcript_8214:512-1123(-)
MLHQSRGRQQKLIHPRLELRDVLGDLQEVRGFGNAIRGRVRGRRVCVKPRAVRGGVSGRRPGVRPGLSRRQPCEMITHGRRLAVNNHGRGRYAIGGVWRPSAHLADAADAASRFRSRRRRRALRRGGSRGGACEQISRGSGVVQTHGVMEPVAHALQRVARDPPFVPRHAFAPPALVRLLQEDLHVFRRAHHGVRGDPGDEQR